MAKHEFNVAAFRAQFPQFADPVKYTDQMLAGYFTMAECYVFPYDTCWFRGDCLQLALDLMTAHLALIYTPDASGNIPGVGLITSATIDKVSVTQAVPTTNSAWRAFLLRTPYGLQLVALLSSKAAGGFYIGGSCERAAIRKAGGRW